MEAAREIPETMRSNMRSLDNRIKADFVKHDKVEPTKPESIEFKKPFFWNSNASKESTSNHRRGLSQAKDYGPDLEDGQNSPSKRHRSRSRAPNTRTVDGSPSKQGRSTSRTRSLFSLKNLSSASLHIDSGETSTARLIVPAPLSSPDEFVRYLRAESEPQKVEIGKVHKLRLLVRNETVDWVGDFIMRGGMPLLFALLRRILNIEWR